MKYSVSTKNFIAASSAALFTALVIFLLIAFSRQPQIYDLFFLASLTGFSIAIIAISIAVIILLFIPMAIWMQESWLRGWLTIAIGAVAWMAISVGLTYSSAGKPATGDSIFLFATAVIGLCSGLSFSVVSKANWLPARKA